MNSRNGVIHTNAQLNMYASDPIYHGPFTITVVNVAAISIMKTY